jgi:chemotaxis protein histidine kinase CheA
VIYDVILIPRVFILFSAFFFIFPGAKKKGGGERVMSQKATAAGAGKEMIDLTQDSDSDDSVDLYPEEETESQKEERERREEDRRMDEEQSEEESREELELEAEEKAEEKAEAEEKAKRKEQGEPAAKRAKSYDLDSSEDLGDHDEEEEPATKDVATQTDNTAEERRKRVFDWVMFSWPPGPIRFELDGREITLADSAEVRLLRKALDCLELQHPDWFGADASPLREVFEIAETDPLQAFEKAHFLVDKTNILKPLW